MARDAFGLDFEPGAFEVGVDSVREFVAEDAGEQQEPGQEFQVTTDGKGLL